MSKSNRERPTPVLVAAANILQALSPSRLGLLLVLYDNDTQTQKEISDLIGRTQSTISTYLQSLGSLSPPLAAKQGKYYTITNTGGKVVGLVNDMARRCDLELRSVNWTDDSDRKDVEALLTPLSDSQIMRPFFILDSLYERSGIDGLMGTPQPVSFDDIVQDVEIRQKEIGESVTTDEIRRTVKQRFDDTDTARFDGEEVTLTADKGHQHAWLWNELLQHLKRQTEFVSGRDKKAVMADVESSSENLDEPTTSRTSPRDSSGQTNNSSSTSEQVAGRSLGSSQSVAERGERLESPSVVPVYTLHSGDAAKERPDSSPLLPLTAKTTIEELAASVDQLANDYNEDTELRLEWMVRTESGVYPLESADSDSSNALELKNRR